jgi:hypothetical protein
LGSKTQIQ